jgi:hypothetical protein
MLYQGSIHYPVGKLVPYIKIRSAALLARFRLARCGSNNMKLNISKCKELIIDFAKDKRSFEPLTVSGNPIIIKLVESE